MIDPIYSVFISFFWLMHTPYHENSWFSIIFPTRLYTIIANPVLYWFFLKKILSSLALSFSGAKLYCSPFFGWGVQEIFLLFCEFDPTHRALLHSIRDPAYPFSKPQLLFRSSCTFPELCRAVRPPPCAMPTGLDWPDGPREAGSAQPAQWALHILRATWPGFDEEVPSFEAIPRPPSAVVSFAFKLCSLSLRVCANSGTHTFTSPFFFFLA